MQFLLPVWLQPYKEVKFLSVVILVFGQCTSVHVYVINVVYMEMCINACISDQFPEYLLNSSDVKSVFYK